MAVELGPLAGAGTEHRDSPAERRSTEQDASHTGPAAVGLGRRLHGPSRRLPGRINDQMPHRLKNAKEKAPLESGAFFIRSASLCNA